MGCCGSKPEISIFPLKSFKPNGALDRAKNMQKTANGITIMNRKKKICTKEYMQSLANNATISRDFNVVLNPPFSDVSELTDYLYLTSVGGLTYENLTEIGINLVINATYEWPNTIMDGIECIRVPIDDDIKDDLTPYFDEVSEIIEEVAQKKGKTLVHCMAGASRSTSLVLAFLIRYERISLYNAFKSVQKRREVARPNIAFWDQLIKYEMKSRKKTSVRMVSVIRENMTATVPHFYEKDFPELFQTEIRKQMSEKYQTESYKGYKENKNNFGQKLKDQ